MALKRKMTFDEMARHMEEHTYRIANRVNVGMYARSLGYHTYKPMIAGKMQFFYINEAMPEGPNQKKMKDEQTL